MVSLGRSSSGWHEKKAAEKSVNLKKNRIFASVFIFEIV